MGLEKIIQDMTEEQALQQWLITEHSNYNYTMKPQPLISAKNLLLGFFYYCQHDVDMALRHHSFHAAHKRTIAIISASEFHLSQCETWLNKLESLAKLHLTPGYLLLAYYCDWLASKTENSLGYELLALKSLMIAQQLEKYSAEAISNAYFGHTIQAIYPEYASWTHAKELLSATIAHHRQTISRLARVEAQYIINQNFPMAIGYSITTSLCNA